MKIFRTLLIRYKSKLKEWELIEQHVGKWYGSFQLYLGQRLIP